MPRRPADPETDRRVERLVNQLFDGMEDERGAIANLARLSGLGHETVRRLKRNPGSSLRTGPTFFVVAAIARARGQSLDDLAEEAMSEGTAGLEAGDP